MKRDFLKNLGLADDVIDKIMAENGADINAARGELATVQQQLQAAQTESAGLKTQLAERDKDIEALRKDKGSSEELTAKLTELQTKYETDTKSLQEKLDQQARDHAAEKFLDGYKFSSKAARKSAFAEFKAKNLKLTDGKFEGAEEFMAALKKEDPTMFAADDKPPKGGDNGGANGDGNGSGNGGNNAGNGGKPHFSNPNAGNGDGGDGGSANPFSFNFQTVRKSNTNGGT